MISPSRPKNFEQEVEVVSCYIEFDGKILMLKRHAKQSHGSKWGLATGKVDIGESKEQAIVRELKEETGLPIGIQELTFIETLYVSDDSRSILFHVFRTQFDTIPEIIIDKYEHSEFDWFTASEILELDLVHDIDLCINRHYVDVRIK